MVAKVVRDARLAQKDFAQSSFAKRRALLKRIRAALIISILVTTVIAIVAGVTSIPSADKLIVGPNFSTIGLGLQDPLQAFTKLGLITAVLDLTI